MSDLNLLNSSPSDEEDQFLELLFSDCLPSSNLEWQRTRALAHGRSSPRSLPWILRTGSPSHLSMTECT